MRIISHQGGLLLEPDSKEDLELLDKIWLFLKSFRIGDEIDRIPFVLSQKGDE